MQTKYLGMIVFALLISANKSEAQRIKACTPSIEPGITLTVSDAKNGKFLDANIIAKEGKYQEKFNFVGGTASGQTIYGGAFERPGKYTLQISRQGYYSVMLQNISVVKGNCHVLTRRLNVRLQPLKTSK